jgi:hypothetical protein
VDLDRFVPVGRSHDGRLAVPLAVAAVTFGTGGVAQHSIPSNVGRP